MHKKPGPKANPHVKLVEERQAHEVWRNKQFYFFVLKRYSHSNEVLVSVRPIGDLAAKYGDSGKIGYAEMKSGSKLLDFNPLVEYDKERY